MKSHEKWYYRVKKHLAFTYIMEAIFLGGAVVGIFFLHHSFWGSNSKLWMNLSIIAIFYIIQSLIKVHVIPLYTVGYMIKTLKNSVFKDVKGKDLNPKNWKELKSKVSENSKNGLEEDFQYNLCTRMIKGARSTCANSIWLGFLLGLIYGIVNKVLFRLAFGPSEIKMILILTGSGLLFGLADTIFYAAGLLPFLNIFDLLVLLFVDANDDSGEVGTGKSDLKIIFSKNDEILQTIDEHYERMKTKDQTVDVTGNGRSEGEEALNA